MLVEHLLPPIKPPKLRRLSAKIPNQDKAAKRDRWPLGQGFERYYGFLGGATDRYYPELTYDNHHIEPPKSPEEGYHLTEDLADKAIEFINDLKAVLPEKPLCQPRAYRDLFKHKHPRGGSDACL